MIKVMLIEDEEKIRLILRKMIEKVEGFEVIAETDSFATSIAEFSAKRPDVVFVDVDLNGDSGIECAKVMRNIDPDLKVIFATAHSEYMANAFEIYAFDYLVKPFDMERLYRTLDKIKGAFLQNSSKEHADSDDQSDKLLVKGKDQMLFIDKKDIVMIERANSSTNIITVDGEYHTSASLSDLEERLSDNTFMRCHKSYIINVKFISKAEPYGRWTYVVKFKNITQTALITSEKFDELKTRFGS